MFIIHVINISLRMCNFRFYFSVEKIKQTVKIDASTVEIEERGVKLRLTVVDTPGFGDSLNSVDWLVQIYIKIKT